MPLAKIRAQSASPDQNGGALHTDAPQPGELLDSFPPLCRETLLIEHGVALPLQFDEITGRTPTPRRSSMPEVFWPTGVRVGANPRAPCATPPGRSTPIPAERVVVAHSQGRQHGIDPIDQTDTLRHQIFPFPDAP